MDGHITGYFVRVERDGKFHNLDIAELTDAELEQFFSRKANAERWAIALARWIRDNVVPFELKVKGSRVGELP